MDSVRNSTRPTRNTTTLMASSSYRRKERQRATSTALSTAERSSYRRESEASGRNRECADHYTTALSDRSRGREGRISCDKLVLLCYRFDHLNKGYSVNVLRVVQIGGILTLLLVGTGVGLRCCEMPCDTYRPTDPGEYSARWLAIGRDRVKMLPLIPEQASTLAVRFEYLFWYVSIEQYVTERRGVQRPIFFVKLNTGDNAMTLTASALDDYGSWLFGYILCWTMRQKNAVNTLHIIYRLQELSRYQWVLWGYSLALKNVPRCRWLWFYWDTRLGRT